MTTPNTGNRRPNPDKAYADLDSAQQDAPEPDPHTHTVHPSHNNLLLPRSLLIGRHHEIAAVQHLLLQEQVGLLTLTGPGGIGKTRLALQVAANLLDHFVDGVYFISLAPISEPGMVVFAISQTLGVREVGGRSLQASLQSYLGNRQLLLLLDNFEQVLAAAPLVADLLANCPRLKILVTSRATLHLYGEHEFAVPPLALPDLKRITPFTSALAASLSHYAAVELFVQRALAVNPDFALVPTNAAAVAEICIRLDGLPLAIELAAPRIKMFAPTALLAQLKQRLTLLTGGPRDVPTRQRTLRDEIAWSYDLLTPAEQRLFQRLAVFVGGFTLQAAGVIGVPSVGSEQETSNHVLDGITTLVDHNLIKQAEASGGEPRFGMLETIREYGLERLNASGEAETIRRLHVKYFLALAKREVKTEELLVEHDNLRAALAWSLSNANSTEIALRLASALREFWTISGYWNEGRRWLEAALAQTTMEERTEAKLAAIIDVGALAMEQGDHGVARVQLEAGKALAEEMGAKQLILNAAVNLGFMAHSQQDYAMAFAHFTEALAIARELEDKDEIASLLLFLGNLARDKHEYAAAQALYEESLTLFNELGDSWSIAAVLHYGGEMAQTRGDPIQAALMFRESLARWRAIGTIQWKGVDQCLDGLAGVCVVQRRFEEAARLFGAAEGLRELRSTSPSLLSHSSAADKHAGLRAALGEVPFAVAWAAGRALSPEQAIDYAVALPEAAEAASPAVTPTPAVPSSPIHPAGLTGREVEVLRLLAQGLTYAQIAEKLVISHRTVNGHVTLIYSKLEVSSRVAATRFAMEHHLV